MRGVNPCYMSANKELPPFYCSRGFICQKTMALAKPCRELFLKIAFPCSGPLEGIPRRSQANDNALCFSGHLWFPMEKSAFEDRFLDHPVQITSILSIQGMNEEDAFINVAAVPFLAWLFQWFQNAKMHNTAYWFFSASMWSPQQLENQLHCKRRPYRVALVLRSQIWGNCRFAKFASFSWMSGDQIYLVIFDWQCED